MKSPLSETAFAPFDRRAFLKRSAATLAVGALSLTRGGGSEDAATPVIDTNVYLGSCPFRRLPLAASTSYPESITALSDALMRHSMVAWASSFEALLQRDHDGINDRLATLATTDRDTGKHFQLFGSINPKISGWRETLHRIHQRHHMRGIRLHPNYHGYTLDDPDFASLLDAASQRNLIVQIVVRMEDVRTQHPATTVADVDVRPLLELLPLFQGLRLQCLNAMRSLTDTLLLGRLSELGVYFDIAMLEGMSGIARTIERVPEIKLCYGSYAPYFYPESAALKLVESGPDLENRNLAAVRSHHAENLLLRA